ncbi:nuclear transport factor 2 family protein [Novosphingobium bradum]|uniref:Nuclear transport factor 2 family protein n=1 Tax=Novosphingobium bradum TaxID=1737444 RepID=A0ABV7IKT8_9SPHN
MDDLQRLVAIEHIRRAKTRYWNGMDFRDPALLRSAFADGPVVLDYRGRPDGPIEGNHFTRAEDCVEWLARVLAPYASSHQGHSVEVDFLSDDEALATWSFSDNFWFKGEDEALILPSLGREYHSWGHYFDRYVRVPQGGWVIAATRFQPIHIDRP